MNSHETRNRIPVWRYAASLLAILFLPAVIPAEAADTKASPAPATTSQALDTKIQSLKKEVLDLNRDLFVLEEELLFPASTELAVFLSLDVGKFFQLDSVELKVDDKIVTHYLYTVREVDALRRGGVQRLYLGNLRVGPHELVAVFTGKGPHDRDYRRATTLTVDKQTDPKFVELKIIDTEQKLQPDFQVKQWQ